MRRAQSYMAEWRDSKEDKVRGAEEVGGAVWRSLHVSSQTLKPLLC